MESSIIIRVKNERENLKKLFEILKNQTYQEFEIVIVNNDSTDGSEKVAFDYFPKGRVKVVNISEFSYPRAINLGIEKASGKYIVILSAHSYPVSKTWLESGLSNFSNDTLAGIFAYPIPGKGSSIWEKVFYGIPNDFRISKTGGHLGNTNSIIRRDLWEKHKFDESLKVAEDYEWSKHWVKKGFLVINDSRFRVNHSHHLGLFGIIKQQFEWSNARKTVNKKFENLIS